MLRADAEKAISLIPRQNRFNLHAIYAETDGKSSTATLSAEHFERWMAWSKQRGIPLDFNPTFFAHPLANDGYTLSHADDHVRNFWIRHDKACRRIAEAMGRNQGSACIVNHWMPDGAKDHPIDRYNPRLRLLATLDEIFQSRLTPTSAKTLSNASCSASAAKTTWSAPTNSTGYVMTRPQMPCLDMGHFHPTENIHDKISALFCYKDELLLHVSRGLRWDSDHVVILNDDIRYLFQEIVRGGFLSKTRIALDFFDASINRIGAWVIGTRAAQKGLLCALLEPTDLLRELEAKGDGASKLALLEELKTYPVGAVWNMFCHQHQSPAGTAWINAMTDSDRTVIRTRQ